MTYSSGGLIQATDYNGFVSTTVGANVNATWSTGATDSGWGQTAISTVSSAGTVTATQWATLVNTLSSMGSQTNTTITARTAPTAGTTIAVLAAVNTDLTNCYTNRGNAAASGTTSSTWTGNAAKTAATGAPGSTGAWDITFTDTITFPSAAQARYFWNAGGLIRLDMGKSGGSTDSDPDWNTFIASMGTLYISGRVGGAPQTIAGTSYTGFTRVGGTGVPNIYNTTQGWYASTPTTSYNPFLLYNPVAPYYTGDYVSVSMVVNSGSTALTITTVWHAAARTGFGQNTNISGGTDTASPFTTFGSAPAVVCRYIPPSSTYLTPSWGTPTIASSVA